MGVIDHSLRERFTPFQAVLHYFQKFIEMGKTDFNDQDLVSCVSFSNMSKVRFQHQPAKKLLKKQMEWAMLGG
jgi:hypothetical protein